MTTRIRRVVTAIDTQGSAFSEVHSETLDGEKWKPNDPVTLANAGAEADTWKEEFNAVLMAERDALVAEVETLTTERDEALAQVEPLETQAAALTAELESLKNPPFNARQLSPHSFMQRYTIDERIATLVAAKTDVTVELILAELQTVQRVRLDVEATQQGVGYLAQQGVIAPERVAEILADATADEQ